MTTDSLAGPAPAKLNLLLRVLAREATGYHGIETVFCRLALADTVTVTRTGRAGAVTLEVTGPDLGPPEDNLAVRAAQLVLRSARVAFGVHVRLEKHIPVAAGLGGGSSDAATTLALVNQLAGSPIPQSELLHLGSRLGADVPFFLTGAPAALGWGHGERLLRLPPLPRAPVLLVTPGVGISTAEAYRWVDEARATASPRGALALEFESLGRWSDIARMAGNDFESAVFGREERVRAAFEALARTRPLLCRMSGSGSTVFAVYRSPRDAEDARQMLGRKVGTVIVTETA